MILIILFGVIGLILFMTMNTRKEIETVKRSRKTTIVVDRPTGEVKSKKVVIDEYDDEEDEDRPGPEKMREVFSSIWDKVK